MIYLWKYNPVTGYWTLVRSCTQDTASDWLRVIQRDDPGAAYKLAKKKPTKPPITAWE